MIRGYPKITDSGKQRVWSAENKDWHIEEKVDGSQLSFCRGLDTLRFFCKGKEIDQNSPGWVFESAISALNHISKHVDPDYMYHGECLYKMRHNVVTYGRIPKFYFVLFDVQNIATGEYQMRHVVEKKAEGLGLEVVQLLYYNEDPKVQPRMVVDQLLLDINEGRVKSMLGGDKPEGVVLKHPKYNKNTAVDPYYVATKIKFVREEFKEQHLRPNKAKKEPPSKISSDESLERIMGMFSKQAYWNKAKFRLRDRGVITAEPENAARERNAIMDEARRDFKEERKETLKDLLWAEFGQRLTQSITDGMGLETE